MVTIQVVLELRPLIRWLLVAEWKDLQLDTEITDIAMPSWSHDRYLCTWWHISTTTGFQALYNHGISLGTLPDGFLRKPMGKLAWKFTTHWDKALPMKFPSSSTLVPCWPLTPFLSCMVLLNTLHPLWLPHSLYHLTAATYLPLSLGLVTFCWLFQWLIQRSR